MAKLLSEFEVYPTSFSKYGTEYMDYLAGRNKAYSIPAKVPARVVFPDVLIPEKIAV